jgi:hypothetical protein
LIASVFHAGDLQKFLRFNCLPKKVLTPLPILGRNRVMKTKTPLLTLALCFATATCFAATSPMMGTWKLNPSKSKFSPGSGKNNMVVYSDAGGGKTKVTVDGVDAAGKATHSEWTGKFDGKGYPVTGDAGSDMRWYKKVDDRTMDFGQTKDGKSILTGRITVAADGKSRTVNTTAMNPKGKKVSNTAVYNKK